MEIPTFLVCEMNVYTTSFLAFDYFEMSVPYKKKLQHWCGDQGRNKQIIYDLKVSSFRMSSQ